VGICVQSFETPLPVLIAKDYSVPYPCQDRACGCQSADECWQSCCCFNDDEKIAWANANGIQPPEWFRARESARESNDGNLQAQVESKTACLCKTTPSQEKEKKVLLCCGGTPVTSSANNSCGCSSAVASGKKTAVKSTSKTLLSMEQYRSCRGLAAMFAHLPPAIVPLAKTSDSELAVGPLAIRLPRLSSLSSCPPTPPPKRTTEVSSF